MKKLAIIIMAVFMTTPAWALFTDDFKTKPFSKTGIWAESGDVKWTGKKLNYVNLGQGSRNNDSGMWVSFTAPTTANYIISFDYRFIGTDKNLKLDDTFSAQIGTDKDSLNKLFEAASSTGLTGSKKKPGAWQIASTSEQPVAMEAGQSYLLRFNFDEAKGSKAPVTSLQIDNVSINCKPILTESRIGQGLTDLVSYCPKPPGDDGHCPPVVPVPGALLLGSIGVGFIGWLRKRYLL